MAKNLRDLVIDGVALVVGSDRQPANPGAKVLVYKAAGAAGVRTSLTNTDKGDPMVKKTEEAAPDTKGIGAIVKAALDSAKEALAKATRTVDSTYTSTSTTKETYTPDPVSNDPVMLTAPAPVAAAAPAVDLAGVVTKALVDALAPLTKAVETLDSRLVKLETEPTGSQVVTEDKIVKSTGIQVRDRAMKMFPGFEKSVLEQTGSDRLTKATIISSNLTYGLHNQEADRFIDYLVDESKLLSSIRLERMEGNTKWVDKLGLASKVLKKATPGVDPGDTVSVNTARVQLVAKEVIAIVSIGDDTLEDNIEGDALLQHIIKMIVNSARNEIEEAVIHGDTAVADTYILDAFDGYYKLAKAGSANVVEAMTDANRFWPGTNGVKATKLIKALPTKFRVDKSKLAFILPPDLQLDYMDSLADKVSADAFGALVGRPDQDELSLRLIKNFTVPRMKTNMSFTYSATPYTDGAFVMLTMLDNLILGMQRDIKIEFQRFARKRCTDAVVTFRLAPQVEETSAIAIYDHAKVA